MVEAHNRRLKLVKHGVVPCQNSFFFFVLVSYTSHHIFVGFSAHFISIVSNKVSLQSTDKYPSLPAFLLYPVSSVFSEGHHTRVGTTMIPRSSYLRGLLQSSGFGSFLSKHGAYSCYASQSVSSLQQVSRPWPPLHYSEDEYADVDWDNLGFGAIPTDYMFVTKCFKDGNFERGQLSRYGKVELSPSAGVLNYGQGVYEGAKAYRKEDGRLLLFRPDQNALRMKMSADRMCMPCPSIVQFVDAVKQTALANKRWVPPPGKGSLYIRPLLMGTGPVLGLAPSPEYTFLVYASPVGNYFKEGFAPLNLYVEEEFHRTSPGGAGGVKSITNYAPGLKAIARAKVKGYSDVLYLDSVNKKNLEEVSACNIFLAKGNVISTPAARGTILQGITRKSIIEIAGDLGYKVEERLIPIEELIDADEVFCTGTAVGVAPVGSITYQDKRFEFKIGAQSVSQELDSIFEGIRRGLVEDKKGWTIEI